MNEADYIEANRRHWDDAVPVHVAAEDFYELDPFRAGRTSLKPLELSEVGDVRGKTLLHLQCHFGMDTLSWAREGAVVTGMDFSHAGIEQARALAAELNLDARFIESSVYDLPNVLDETFDIVFTSYGVLGWLPDMQRWAEVVARFVKPGGVFYIAEMHPIAQGLDDTPGISGLRPRDHYFDDAPPFVDERDGTYADAGAHLEHHVSYGFQHSLGTIVTSLIDAGLQIEFLHEWPFTTHQALPGAFKGDDGYWHLAAGEGKVPLLFSLRAHKPA
jgi:ubiquinone/menaquinone biosynthesis C-methylase UbiE